MRESRPTMVMRKKILLVTGVLAAMLLILGSRILYIQVIHGEILQDRAYEQHTRDRLIRPDRGNIYDRNGVGLAVTRTVATVSVIRSQVEDAELVAQTLSDALDMDLELVQEKVGRRVALERIKSHVCPEIATELRRLNIPGIIIDEDVERVYPFGDLAAQVIGFVGIDNQGIIGLEAKYDSHLAGQIGKILTETDARGREFIDSETIRIAPVDGNNLVTTLDSVVQQFAQQTIEKAVEAKQAIRGAIIVMNPQTGEILAMANVPSFDLNEPFTINNADLAQIWEQLPNEERMNHLNQMWRNFTINDTFEPGSTFKIVTSAAGLEEGVIDVDTMFVCTGSRTVGGRQIGCWRRPRSHGSLNFIEGVQHSCNPVFMEIGERLGAETFHEYMGIFGFTQRTGVDLPGEAVGIMFPVDKIGPVELAVMSFGQSFQITPLQLMRASAATVNGGYMITPHVGMKIIDNDGNLVESFIREQGNRIISPDTSILMKEILESVVYVGTGHRSYIPGYRIGGKTATSQKLPRGSGRYIASFLTFAPAENPEIMAFVLIDEPKGAYYGGQVAGPVMKELLASILPYLQIAPVFNEEELEMDGVGQVAVPSLANQNLTVAKQVLGKLGLEAEVFGSGRMVINQFPLPSEIVNQGSRVILYTAE
ncbi:MAG: penicillin-binding transpeptidase domain-containing protein [Defluviitaleaceae bacterium]|nr:penicillin-binding transpeptidase domain-containing protein [Defluviitaleaceae bacterium]